MTSLVNVTNDYIAGAHRFYTIGTGTSNDNLTNFSIQPKYETVRIQDSNVFITGSIYPTSCNVYDLGSSNYRWRDLYLSGNTIDLGGTRISRNNTTGGMKISSKVNDTPLDFTAQHITALGTLYASNITIGGNALIIGDNGNVGMGTALPTQKLDVRGNIYASGNIVCSNISVIGDFVRLDTITSNTEQMVISNNGTGPALKVIQTGTNSIAEFYDDGGVLALKIANGGHVGIGTADPQVKLDVASDSFKVVSIQRINSAGGAQIELKNGSGYNVSTFIGADSNMYFQSGDAGGAGALTKAFILAPSGNVGIGTNNPTHNLHVIGSMKATTSIDCDTQFLGQASDSATVPSFSFTTDTNTGIFRPAADTLSISCGGAERLRVDASGSVGISTTVPFASLHVGGSSGTAVTGSKQLYIAHATTGNSGWYIGNQVAAATSGDNDLYFAVNRLGTVTDAGFVQDTTANATMNFTGQHRCFIDNMHTSNVISYEGLIVSANMNSYIRMSNGIVKGKNAITINESLPCVQITFKAKDKSVFGVISYAEDPNKREDEYGAFVSIFPKEVGDNRVYINSVGEGAIWVSDCNGDLESGDYITSSSIKGYGMKQDEPMLMNFTVAKITMDCSFTPRMISQKKIKLFDGKNVLDQYGNLQWEDVTNENNEILYETEYKIRYLTSEGILLSESEYIYAKNNGEAVYIAAFVGCTYHSG